MVKDRRLEMAEGRTVVIAMDGSDYSNYAFEWYMKNTHKAKDNVVIVHCPEYHAVIRSPMMADATVVSELLAEEDRRITALLNDLGDKLKDAGIGGKVKSVGGTAGNVVVKVAEEENASMIIMGCRGMGTIRRTILGSVSDYVLHHSRVPVLICRHKDGHHKHQ